MVRKIEKNDLPFIYDLGNRYTNNFFQTYNLEHDLNSDICILNCYEEDNIIKGFIYALNIDSNVEILLLYVDEKYYRQNVGSSLLESVEKLGKTALLEVSVENTPAYNLYLKRGYQEISRRKGYYNGVDAIVMKKVL